MCKGNMKSEIEEKVALEALGDTTTVKGFINPTTASKTAESDYSDKIPAEDRNEEKTGEENEESQGGLRDYARIFTFSDRLDRCLYTVALLCSIGYGTALPIMVCSFPPRTAASC